MKKSYEEVLLDANISFEQIISSQQMPQHLYKYQCFDSQEGEENRYWRDNLRGAFHLSLGKDFEDKNDCKPYMDKKTVCDYIQKFFLNLKVAPEQIQQILDGLDDSLTQNFFESIISNYQKDIRVGCFTKSSDNSKLWGKYANNETGYCLEYETQKSELFMHSTLPILYLDNPFNSSIAFANALILESVQKGKNRTLSDQLAIFGSVYEKNVKWTYVPLFIKERDNWSFEEEYRLFLLKNRNTQIGELKAKDYLDAHANINLSSTITTIYLGKRFDMNPNHKVLQEEIDCIAKEMGVTVIQKQ